MIANALPVDPELTRAAIEDLPGVRAKALGRGGSEAHIHGLPLQILVNREDVEVQVGVLAVAGISAVADQVARGDAIADVDMRASLLQVQITGDGSIFVEDEDQVRALLELLLEATLTELLDCADYGAAPRGAGARWGQLENLATKVPGVKPGAGPFPKSPDRNELRKTPAGRRLLTGLRSAGMLLAPGGERRLQCLW